MKMEKNKTRIKNQSTGTYRFTPEEKKLFEETDRIAKSFIHDMDPIKRAVHRAKFLGLLEEFGIRSVDEATPDQLDKLYRIMQKRKYLNK